MENSMTGISEKNQTASTGERTSGRGTVTRSEEAKMKSSQLEATAYHEAGHAVAAWQLKIALRRKGVTIVPDLTTGRSLTTGHGRMMTKFRGCGLVCWPPPVLSGEPTNRI